ncbi:MAG TPA: hypothetical protein VK177_14135 [Flavobacteriales bacterium]|nr:hypothetical protein [Flavobacteriales bacterium]
MIHESLSNTVFLQALKRFLAISLLSLYLITGTELKQFLKLPVLVQHYQEHKTQNAQLDFYSFLAMHYAGDDMNENDQERDSQLPFRSCDQSLAQPVVLPACLTASIRANVQFYPINKIVRPQHFHSPSFYASIWQPPKIQLFIPELV